MFIYVQNRFNTKPTVTRLASAAAPSECALVPYIDAPLMVLPRDTAGLRALRSSGFWRKRAAERRKFETEFGAAAFKVITDAPSLKLWLPRVHELFLKRWAGEHSGSKWMTQQGFSSFSQAMIELAAEGQACLAILYREDNEELLSYGYLVESPRTLHFFQHATSTDPRYKSHRLGQAFLTQLLSYAVQSERFDSFDFMIGLQPYKLEWATCIQRTWRIIDRKEHATSAGFYMAIWRAHAEEFVRRTPWAYACGKRLLNFRLRRP